MKSVGRISDAEPPCSRRTADANASVATTPAMPPIASRAASPGPSLFRFAIAPAIAGPRAFAKSELDAARDRLELLQPLAHGGELDARADVALFVVRGRPLRQLEPLELEPAAPGTE